MQFSRSTIVVMVKNNHHSLMFSLKMLLIFGAKTISIIVFTRIIIVATRVLIVFAKIGIVLITCAEEVGFAIKS